LVPEPFDASGCFETLRVVKGRAAGLEEHIKRLGRSMKTLGLKAAPEKELALRIQREAARLGDGQLRVAVRRSGELLIHATKERRYPEEKKGVALVTAATRWPAGEAGWAQAKQSERLSGILARLEAGDAPEVLRIGPHGTLTEGTVSNLFFVKEGILYTPPAWAGVLEGTTRKAVLEAAARLGIPSREVPVTRHELFNADEAFLTNVFMTLLPVREVDGRSIGSKLPGPVTLRLLKALKGKGTR
jgi:branched-chain amino acid aminotransferase